MPVTPTGPISKILDHAETLFAISATFQSCTGAIDADAAKAFIHLVEVSTDDDSPPTRPMMIIEHDSYESERVAGGATNTYAHSGTITVWIEHVISEADEVDASHDFTNKVGAILQEIQDLAGSGTYLNVTNWDWLERPTRAEDDAGAVTDLYICHLELEWSDL